MADEEKIEAPVVETEVVEPVVEVAPEPVEPEPHPLEPGGKRFAEVYGEMKDARREAQELRERLARIEGQVAATQPKPAAPAIYTAAQLQAAVDTGRITPAQMAHQLAWQEAQTMRVQVERDAEIKARSKAALTEINQYVDKVPALMQAASPEFRKVAAIAREIAEETGKSVDDPIIQRRALREAMGPLERLTKVRDAVNSPRGNVNMDGVTSPGGMVNSGKPDPFKDVPQMYKDHWKKLNYTEEQMKAELAFIKPKRVR